MADDDFTTGHGEESGADPVLTEALSMFGNISDAQQEERALALQDRRFVSIAGAQWEGDWQQQFQNSIMVEVNKTAQGVEKIIADYRNNRMIVDFRAVDNGPAEETADTLNGMFRADVYASKGQQAFDCAFEEAVQGGQGAWRLTNRYSDDADPDDDSQRVCIDIICDADQRVFWDMNARLYDKSDARYCFVVTAMTPEAYKEEYGDDPASWPDDILKTYYDWYTPDMVRVCEFYRVEGKTQVRIVLRHKLTDEIDRVWQTEADDLEKRLVAGWEVVSRKRVKRREVAKYTFSAAKQLEPRKVVAGDQIPVVPVYGKRWFIDNMERCRGHVRLAKDPQRIYNAQISKLTETASVAPMERPIFFPEQVANHEASWAEANINRAPYALINPIIGPDGAPLPAGPVATMTPPQLSPVLAALMQVTAADIAELTTSDGNSDEIRSNVSAEAMDIAATRTDAKTFTYMDNMRQSMQRCGEIYLSMARAVYVEEGREVETMDEEGRHGFAVLGEPTMDDKGQVYAANDISAKFRVISDVTEATATRRDKTVRSLVAGAQTVATFDPELSSAMIGVALQNMDGEGISDLKDWNRKRLVQRGVVQPTEEEQAAMDEVAQNAPPDAQSEYLLAAAEEKRTSAIKNEALTGKAQADAALSEANTDKALADAERLRAETREGGAERRIGVMERVKGLFQPQRSAA